MELFQGSLERNTKQPVDSSQKKLNIKGNIFMILQLSYSWRHLIRTDWHRYVFMLHGVYTVSYTHLDVYKRQHTHNLIIPTHILRHTMSAKRCCCFLLLLLKRRSVLQKCLFLQIKWHAFQLMYPQQYRVWIKG